MGANVISSLYVEFAADTKKFAAAMTEVSRMAREVDKVIKPIKDRAADAGRALTVGFTVPVVAGFAAVTKAGMDFETAFSGVRKTVNDTNEQGLQKLRAGIRALALELPVAATEIAAVAENAGQLGVKSQDILKFSKVMINLGTTTNLSAVEASQALARFTNITGTSKDNIDRLGSALFKLDVNSASSAQEIATFGLRIAAAGKIVGLTDPQILAFGASLSSVGIEAEAGGTAISTLFIKLANSVAGGGKKLQQFAAIAGMSADEFKKAFKTDAAEAVVTFIEGLKRVRTEGGNVFGVLDEMGLKEKRLRNALLASAEAGSLLRDNIKQASKAFQENTALTAGAAEKYKTTAAQLQLLKNQLTDIGITLFDSLGPVLRDTVIPNLKSLSLYAADAAQKFNALSPEVKNFTFYVLAIGAVAGPALLALTKMASTIVGLGSLAVKAGLSITGLTTAISAVTLLTAVKSYGDLSAAISLIGGTSVAATAGLVAIAAAVGVAIGMFINWALKVTGLEGSLDKLLKTTVEWIPVVGKWATGANAAADSTKSAAFTADATAAAFAKYGITVDKARLGDASYVQQLRAGVEARQKTIDATKAATGVTKDATVAAKTLTQQQQLMNDAFDDGPSAKKLQQLRDALEKAAHPADFLNKELQKYRALGATNQELTRGFADEIVKAAEAQQLHGFAVKGIVADLYKEADAFTKVEEAAKTLKKFQDDMAKGRQVELVDFSNLIPQSLKEDLKSKTLEGINAQRTAVYQLNDALAQMKYLAPEDAVRLFGDQLKSAAEYARYYGNDALSPTTQKLIEFMERTADAKDAQDKFNATSDKGIDAMIAMRENMRTTVEAITRMKNSGASTKQVVGILGSDIKALGENAKLLGVQLDEPTKALIRMQEQTERTSELSKKMKDAWSTAVGNITSQFADGVTAMIFSGKKFSVSIKNIFLDLGKSMVKILVTDAFTSITKGFTNMLLGLGGGGSKGLLGGVLGGLGSKLGSLLGIGGGAAAAGAGGAGAAGAGAAAGGAGAGGASIAALATNPITIAAAAAIAGALIIKKFVGQGRRTANEFVQEVQNPFGSNLSQIVDTFDAAKKAGTLTLEQAQQSKDALTELWSSFVSTATQFASQGDTEAKVVKQAFDSLKEYFGTDLSKVFGPMDETIKALKEAAANATAGSNVPGVGAGIPQTGRAQSASEIFAKAVERFDAAIDRVTGGALAGAGAGGITVQYEDKREINFYGVPESLQMELRDTIEPALIRDFENNTRGITAALIAILNNAQGGVTNTVPATT